MQSKINKIVIIDDEESICMLLSHILKKVYYQTFCAYSLNEGSDLIKKEKPELVFLDINLPDGSGFDLLSKIKSNGTEVKVVIVSAYDDEDELSTARENGADDFISKPFTINDIKDVVEKMEANF